MCWYRAERVKSQTYMLSHHYFLCLISKLLTETFCKRIIHLQKSEWKRFNKSWILPCDPSLQIGKEELEKGWCSSSTANVNKDAINQARQFLLLLCALFAPRETRAHPRMNFKQLGIVNMEITIFDIERRCSHHVWKWSPFPVMQEEGQAHDKVQLKGYQSL